MNQNEFNQLVKDSFENNDHSQNLFSKVIIDNNNHLYLHLYNGKVLSCDLKTFNNNINANGVFYAIEKVKESLYKQIDKLNTKNIYENCDNLIVEAEPIGEYEQWSVVRPLLSNLMLVLKKYSNNRKQAVYEDDVNIDIYNATIWNKAIENTYRRTNISIIPEILVDDDIEYYKEFMRETFLETIDETRENFKHAIYEYMQHHDHDYRCNHNDEEDDIDPIEGLNELDDEELVSIVVDNFIGAEFLNKYDFEEEQTFDNIVVQREYNKSKKTYKMFQRNHTSLFSIVDNYQFTKHFYTFLNSPYEYLSDIFDVHDFYIVPLDEYNAFVYVVNKDKAETIRAIKEHQDFDLEENSHIVIRYSVEKKMFLPECI